MTRFNLSINAISPQLAEKLAGNPYSLSHVLDIAQHISKKADLIIAPVWVPGINDNELPKLITLTKKLQKTSKHSILLGIQNFLCYKFGRRPAKSADWDTFKKKLTKLEKEHNIKLILDFKKDFNIEPTKPLPKPFRKGQKIYADIICPGRVGGEKIAASGERTITLPNCTKTGRVKIKITRTKHNIFYGVCV